VKLLPTPIQEETGRKMRREDNSMSIWKVYKESLDNYITSEKKVRSSTLIR
jgi:hypothetical protein